MRNFLSIYTLIAFALGVFLSGWVMSLTGKFRSKASSG